MNGLVNRDGIFYFRIRIPSKFLKAFDNRREIWKSLGSKSEQDAQRLCVVLMGRVEQFFNLLRSGMLSESQMRHLAVTFLREQLTAFESARAQPNQMEEEKDWDNTDIPTFDTMIDDIRKDLSRPPDDTYLVKGIVDDLINDGKLKADKGSHEYYRLLRHFTKAFLDFIRIEKERRQGNYANEFDSLLHTTTLHPSETQTKDTGQNGMLISTLIPVYVDEKMSGDRWDVKTRQQNESSLALMVEIMGDQPVSTISHQLMMGLRNTLKSLPANRSKEPRYRDKSIEAVLRLKNIKPMSITTVNNTLTRIASFWNWAETHEYIDKSPARHLMLPTSKRADEERSVYSNAELQLLLDTIAEQSRPISHPERVWLVLIALYSGMRPNESAQLYIDDVVSEDGVLCFRVNTLHPDQKVKNQRARRIVPVHPVLIEFGFEKYVHSLSRNQSKRLFPKLKHHRDGYHAYYGRWLQKINRQNVTKDKTKTFYSCRHNFITGLKQAGIDFTVIAEIVGHTVPGETLGRYGKAQKPSVLLDAMNLLSYKVDLAKIRKAVAQTYQRSKTSSPIRYDLPH